MLFITITVRTTIFVVRNDTNRMRRSRETFANPVPASKHLICGFYIQPGHPIRSSAKESRSAYGGVLSQCGCVMLGTMIIFKPLCWAIKLPEWHAGESCLYTLACGCNFGVALMVFVLAIGMVVLVQL